EPLLFGRSTGLSPVALLVAVIFWTWLWGPIGLLLSTPLTVCLVVLGRYISGLEFFDVLLGDEPALEPPVHYYQRLVARDPDEAIDLVEDYLKEHPREQVYDDLLIPALVMAKRDRERGVLSEEEEQTVYQETRQTLEQIVPEPGPGPVATPSGLVDCSRTVL